MLADAIADIHARSRGTYGILRIKAALELEQGLIVNTKLVRRIMRELGIQGFRDPRRGYKNLKNAPPVRTWSSASSPPPLPTSCG
jgi:transposase